MKKTLAVVLGSCVVLVLGLGFTSIPARWMLHEMLGSKKTVENLSGNYFSGYTFSRIQGSTAGVEYDFHDGKVVPAGLKSLLGSPHISLLEIGRVAITFGPNMVPPGSTSPLVIDSLRFGDFALWSGPNLKTQPTLRRQDFSGGEIKAKGLDLRPSVPAFEEISGHGPVLDFTLTNATSGDADLNLVFKGTLKPNSESMYVREIPITAILKRTKQGLEGTLSALNDRLHVAMDKSLGLDVAMKDVTPMEEIKTRLPLKQINLKMKLDGRSVFMSALSAAGPARVPINLDPSTVHALEGGFVLGDTKFDISPAVNPPMEAKGALGMAKGSHSGKNYVVYFKPYFAKFLPGMWLLRGPSKELQEPMESFATFYYGKSVAQLSPVEKKKIQSDSNFFWKRFYAFGEVGISPKPAAGKKSTPVPPVAPRFPPRVVITAGMSPTVSGAKPPVKGAKK